MVWDPVTASIGRSATCKLVAIGRSKEEPGVDLPSACVKDGKLYAQVVCVMCRMADAGWSGVALIGEMTPEQALAFQQGLGLPGKDPLLSEEAWTAAIAAARRS